MTKRLEKYIRDCVNNTRKGSDINDMAVMAMSSLPRHGTPPYIVSDHVKKFIDNMRDSHDGLVKDLCAENRRLFKENKECRDFSNKKNHRIKELFSGNKSLKRTSYQLIAVCIFLLVVIVVQGVWL